MQKKQLMQFSDFPIHTTILKALTESKYHTATPVQQEVIPLVIDKKDVVVTAQTGTGKTAAFALPIIQGLLKEQDAEKGGKKIKALIKC